MNPEHPELDFPVLGQLAIVLQTVNAAIAEVSATMDVREGRKST